MADVTISPHGRVWRWLDENLFELAREMRLSYLPPLMVYVAAGISGLTGIVGTFFVKEYLHLSAAFLAAIGFWAGIPWALKMPVGHLVDLIWRWKGWLVWLGASMIAASLGIMYGLIAHTGAMAAILRVEVWFVVSALLSPCGYMVQDAVADALTVEAVPRVDDAGAPLGEADRKLMHTTMQTLGRVAIIGGGILVAAANVFLFRDAAALPEQAKAALYADVYLFALLIPLVSVAGVVLASVLRRHEAAGLARQGLDAAAIARAQAVHGDEPTRPNWLILGGSLVFVLVTLVVGTSDFPWAQETIFAASFVIVMVLLARLARELAPDKREVLVATALVLFVYRAVPGTGAGTTWWMIDELGFDQAFIARLSLIGSVLTLAGMFVFRRFMAEKSIAQIIVILTLASSVLALPTIGMVYGLHHWTAAHTGGVLDARMIALIDTALESPLGQIAMIPMLAWIANSAPANLKATYFAVMASFANLALSAAQLGTRYLNEVFVVSRAVKDRATGTVKIPADYSQVGELLIVATLIGLVVPLTAVLAVRMLRLRTA